MKHAALFLLMVIASIRAADVYAAPHAITEQEYWALIQTTRDTVANLGEGEPEVLRNKLQPLASQLQSFTYVTLQSRETIPVNNSVLITAMTSYAPDLEQIKSMLDALITAHKEYPAHVFSTADLDSLASITARPEFQWKDAQETNPVTKWIQGLWDKFLRWLEKLLNLSQSSGQNGEAKPSILPFIATLLLAVVLFFVFRSLFGDLINEARSNGNGDESQELLTADAAFEKAQSLSRGGDYRSAVRYLYLSSLLLLDERGLLRYDRSKTNREYLKSIANSPELAGPLSEVIDVFDNVWYGYHTLGEESFKHYSARVEELKEKKQ